jgi:hypothetical protein
VRDKKFTWDARGAAAVSVATIAIIVTLLVPAAWAPLVGIVNTLAVALVLRTRVRWDRRDVATVLVAGAAVLGALGAPTAAPAVGIANALLIALSLRQRR